MSLYKIQHHNNEGDYVKGSSPHNGRCLFHVYFGNPSRRPFRVTGYVFLFFFLLFDLLLNELKFVGNPLWVSCPIGISGKLVKTTGIIHTVTEANFFLQMQPTKRWASIQVYLGAQTADQQDTPTILQTIAVGFTATRNNPLKPTFAPYLFCLRVSKHAL
jgi:hypothetical protein